MATWDKQHGVGVEQARLLERTRQLVARGQSVGNLWHTATHAEHARPMLQVLCSSPHTPVRQGMSGNDGYPIEVAVLVLGNPCCTILAYRCHAHADCPHECPVWCGTKSLHDVCHHSC